MKRFMERFVSKFGKQLCSLAGLAAIISVYSCRGFYYQPEEPEGLAELAMSKKKR